MEDYYVYHMIFGIEHNVLRGFRILTGFMHRHFLMRFFLSLHISRQESHSSLFKLVLSRVTLIESSVISLFCNKGYI